MEHCASNKEKHCHHEHFTHDGCHHHCEHENWQEAKANYFLELADEAWEEILKEKIKSYILKNQSERLDNLAKVVAEGNAQRWKSRMEEKQGCKNFMEELCKFFAHEKNKRSLSEKS